MWWGHAEGRVAVRPSNRVAARDACAGRGGVIERVATAVVRSALGDRVARDPDDVEKGEMRLNPHEASVWSIPPGNSGLIKKVQEGKATLANLLAGGATLHGCFTG